MGPQPCYLYTGNARIVLDPGLYRLKPEIESLFKAKEKRQNREQFP